MNLENLTTYLRDHLAGSIVALEALDHLIIAFQDRPEGTQIVKLKTEVEADQAVVKALLSKLVQDESALKKAGAWMAEKLLMTKVKAEGELGTLEVLEMLVLGIEGKLRLWRSLSCLDTGLNLPELEAGATRQIQFVENLRLQVAQRALADAPSEA